MRRLVAIGIVIFIGFWIAYGLFDQVKIPVNNFALTVAGPAIYNFFAGIVNGITNQFGLGGFAAITMAIGLLGGIVAHLLWVKADWTLRRWGASRTATDLGTTTVTQLPSTPIGATTRPAQDIVAEVQTEPALGVEDKK